MKTQEKENRAEQQAKAQYESIKEMVEALHEAENNDDDDKRVEAIEAIQQDPLSVQVRSGWHNADEAGENAEYEILLCWGGPACRIIGELDEHAQPDSAIIQYQDWFTSWTDYNDVDDEILLDYARQFYFGE